MYGRNSKLTEGPAWLTFRFDPQSQNVLANIYITRAEKVGGEVQNVLVQTIPEARDPWWLENAPR